MAVDNTLQQLVHEILDLKSGEAFFFLLEILLQVQVEVLESQVELILAVRNVEQLNDVRMA